MGPRAPGCVKPTMTNSSSCFALTFSHRVERPRQERRVFRDDPSHPFSSRLVGLEPLPASRRDGKSLPSLRWRPPAARRSVRARAQIHRRGRGNRIPRRPAGPGLLEELEARDELPVEGHDLTVEQERRERSRPRRRPRRNCACGPSRCARGASPSLLLVCQDPIAVVFLPVGPSRAGRKRLVHERRQHRLHPERDPVFRTRPLCWSARRPSSPSSWAARSTSGSEQLLQRACGSPVAAFSMFPPRPARSRSGAGRR